MFVNGEARMFVNGSIQDKDGWLKYFEQGSEDDDGTGAEEPVENQGSEQEDSIKDETLDLS